MFELALYCGAAGFCLALYVDAIRKDETAFAIAFGLLFVGACFGASL